MKKIFNNLTIQKKLFVGYGVIILITIILAASNLISLMNVNKSYTNLQAGAIEGNQLALQIGRECTNMRRLLTRAGFMAYDETEYKTSMKTFDDSVEKIRQIFEDFINVSKNDTGFNSESERTERIKLAQEILNLINGDYLGIRNVIESIVIGSDSNKDAMLKDAINEASLIAIEIDTKLDSIINETDARAHAIAQQTTNDTYSTELWSIIFAASSVILSIIFAMLIGSAIKNPIVKLVNDAKKIAEGNLETSVRSNNKDEIGIFSNAFGDVVDIFSLLANSIDSAYSKLLDGELEVKISEQVFPGDYKKVAVAVNNAIQYLEESTISGIECAQEYAKGNFNATIRRYPGAQAVLNESYDLLQNHLKSVNQDVSRLIENAVEGKLDVKIDSIYYEGDWRKIAEGLNKLLTAIDMPVSEVCDVLEQVSAGNFKVSIKGDYKGRFEMMKAAVNKTVKNSAIYIEDISDILTKISAQNLDVYVTKDYIGDYEIIKTSLIKIIDTFNTLIREFMAVSEQVAAGARQISESSIMLSQGATEQASAIEELAATSESISEQTSVNAKNSEKASNLSIGAKDKGIASKTEMEEMLKSMNFIEEASANISKIIKVIDDIAFQTNLLSLNATIEAARAGVHGKGFAVVSEEVRNLAGRSKKAASETSDLISKMLEIVSNGTTIAHSTASSLNIMVEQISDITDLIQSVSSASQEQDVAINQVNEGVMQISEVTQANTATSEEAASMSQELSSQSELLKNTLSRFKCKRGDR